MSTSIANGGVCRDYLWRYAPKRFERGKGVASGPRGVEDGQDEDGSWPGQQLAWCLARLQTRFAHLKQLSAPSTPQHPSAAKDQPDDVDPALSKGVSDIVEILQNCLELEGVQSATAATAGEAVLETHRSEKIRLAIAKVVPVRGDGGVVSWGRAMPGHQTAWPCLVGPSDF